MIFTAVIAVDDAGAADYTWTAAQLAAARADGCAASISSDPTHYETWSVQCPTLSGSTSVAVKGTPYSGGESGAEVTLSTGSPTDDDEVVVSHNGLAYTGLTVSLGGAYTGNVVVRLAGYRGPR